MILVILVVDFKKVLRPVLMPSVYSLTVRIGLHDYHTVRGHERPATERA